MPGILGATLGAASGMFSGALVIGTDGGSNFGFFTGTYGSLTPSTFVDHGSTSRTISAWNWDVTASGTVGFRLSGTSISNSDTTFVRILTGGRVLLRSAATYTANDGGGRTLWSWSTNTSGYPSSGTIQAIVQ